MVVALINERESEGATPPEVLPLAGSGGLFSARNPTRFLTTAQGRVTTALARLELFVSQLSRCNPNCNAAAISVQLRASAVWSRLSPSLSI